MVDTKSESELEKQAHKIHWGFEIETDHLILVTKPDLDINSKKEKRENLPSS